MSRRNRPNPHHFHCPRCGETGDPRSCTCMRAIRREVEEARQELLRGRPMYARSHLANVERKLDLLGLDAAKAAGVRTERPMREAA